MIIYDSMVVIKMTALWPLRQEHHWDSSFFSSLYVCVCVCVSVCGLLSASLLTPLTWLACKQKSPDSCHSLGGLSAFPGVGGLSAWYAVITPVYSRLLGIQLDRDGLYVHCMSTERSPDGFDVDTSMLGSTGRRCNVFTSVCLFVCLSVNNITQIVMGGFS